MKFNILFIIIVIYYLIIFFNFKILSLVNFINLILVIC